MSLIRLNVFGRRWFLRAPWQPPLYSERYETGQAVHFRFMGWRVTSRIIGRRVSDGSPF